MAEDELMPFDPSMKKKKKKKKTAFDPDAGMADGEVAADGGSAAAEAEVVDDPKTEAPADDGGLNFDFSGMKKKKKKKKAVDLDELGEALPDVDEGETQKTDKPEVVGESVLASDITSADLTFDLPLKKKKKKKVDIDTSAVEAGAEGVEEGGENPGKAWHGSDRDYTYDELLTRVFDIMREKNPDMVAGEKKKFVMRPPQVVRVGARKSSFVNFAEITRLLHRQPKHVLAFLMAELGTSGSVDGNNQLIIRGKYNQKQIESVLRRYIKEYVTCHTCRSPDTLLQKDTRLFFLQCETCGSRCSVANIKSGFQAVTGKRAAIRAKTA